MDKDRLTVHIKHTDIGHLGNQIGLCPHLDTKRLRYILHRLYKSAHHICSKQPQLDLVVTRTNRKSRKRSFFNFKVACPSKYAPPFTCCIRSPTQNAWLQVQVGWGLFVFT